MNAERLIDLLLEGPPSDPNQRAVYRIKSLMDRFGGDENKVDKHTALRATKTRDAKKLAGILWAAKKLKLKRATAAAEKQLALVR